jgi:hypothetical protein
VKIRKVNKTTAVFVLLIVVFTGALTGCAGTSRKSSGIISSQEATDIWHAYDILPNYHYYYYGPDAQPFYVIGIDDQYRLASNLWKPVDLTPAMLKSWFNYIQPRVGYDPQTYGAFITGPNGERIGLWYSVRDWRRKGSARLDDDNQLSITTPPVTNPSRMRLFRFERYDWD